VTMNRRTAGLLVAVALLLSAFPAHAKRRAVVPRPPSVVEASAYLNEAIAAAEWLATLERPTSTGLAWARGEGQNAGGIGVDSGAAGIGAFHLRLYQTTRQPRFLDKAQRAAAYIASEFRAGRFYSHEWLAGGAGGGDFLLQVYAVTNDQSLLHAAHLVGDSLIRTAIRDGDGIYWKHNPQIVNVYTGIAHGAAGSAMFLVKLYNAGRDSRYLAAAEEAYRWIARHTIELQAAPRAITWKRLITDSAGYNGWCGGSMGMALLLDELHRATGKQEYLDAWMATAEGLLVGAARPELTPLELAWGHAPATGTALGLSTAYCHGTSANAVILAEAVVRTGEARFASAPAAAGRWLDRVAIAGPGGGHLWEHFVGGRYRETGLLTGAASVGHGSLKLYALTGDVAHLQRAGSAAAYLTAVADHPRPGQSRWLDRFDNSGEPPVYESGIYGGAAGIGIFLLELHDSQRGRLLSNRFSPMNP
jgi:uncharacterized protein YyaL (SSP411 family)